MSLCDVNQFISLLYFQFNILNDKVYDLLGQIYNEMFAMFDTDVFHMGGDEVGPHIFQSSSLPYLPIYLHYPCNWNDDV